MDADGGYRLVAGTAMPPLLLDDDEAVAVTVGLATAARRPVQGIGEASVRALAKLEQVLPSRLRYRVRSLNAVTVQLAAENGPGVDPGQLTTLAAALPQLTPLRGRSADTFVSDLTLRWWAICRSTRGRSADHFTSGLRQ
jgi:predicted DNA-binding transcriptional regulator YafY